MKRWVRALCAVFLLSVFAAQPAFADARAGAALGLAARAARADAIDARSYGAQGDGSTDDTAALQNAINAAISANKPLFIPAASNCYKTTAALTINGNLTISGDHVAENWGGNIMAPQGSPPLLGSVICPTSGGYDAIDITAQWLTVNVYNLGIRFLTPFTGTGDGIHYVVGASGQGLFGAVWSNVKVFGHDGDHYAYNLQNIGYVTFYDLHSYGGGGVYVYGIAGTGNYGNAVFVQPYLVTLVQGTADTIKLRSNGAQQNNLFTFIRPQAMVVNDGGVTPGTKIPTGSQYMFTMDTTTQHVRLIAPDFETNVSSPIQWGAAVQNNDMDWSGMFTTASSIFVPAWTTNGVRIAPGSRTVTDTTSSGTVPLMTIDKLEGVHVNASSATTYTRAATLYVAPPVMGTNASVSQLDAIYATAQIETTGNLSSNGLFVTGTSQINNSSSSNTTQIGTGNTTGAVTVGGGSNVVTLGSPTKVIQYTVAGLPTCNAGAKGEIAEVNDATSPTYLGALTGGGSTLTPAICNGTSWASF